MLLNVILKKIGIVFIILCIFTTNTQISAILFSHSVNLAYAAPGGTDTDNDGVDDIDDLDDDNDGILDSVELNLTGVLGTAASDSIIYTEQGGQVLTIGGNTNGLGFRESGWEEAVIKAGGTILQDLNPAANSTTTATFSNGNILAINNANSGANGSTIASSNSNVFISGNSGSGLNFSPGDASDETDDQLTSAAIINFTSPVYAFGFDWIDFMDHGGVDVFSNQYQFFIDGELIFNLVGNSIGAGNVGSFDIQDGNGNLQGSLISGQNIEVFIGYVGPNPITQAQIVMNSTSISHNTGGQDVYGLDSFRFVTNRLHDLNGDGLNDAVDLDRDDDGIADIYESGNSDVANLDSDGDGTISLSEGFVDNGLLTNSVAGNGLDDRIENLFGTPNIGVIPVDSFNTSGDNTPDYLDLDSDDDGIPDATEARASNQYISYASTGATLDSDNDGILNLYDSDNTVGVGSGAIFGSTHVGFKTSNRGPENTDGTDTPDFLDLNSDNDEFLDSDVRESGIVSGVSYSDPDGDVDDPLTNGTLDNNDADTSDVDFRSLDTSDISGYVWNDVNMNGVQDTSETAHSGATIRLISSTGTVLASRNTDFSGDYSFTGVVVGEYSLEIIFPVDFGLSPTGGGTSTTDSDFDRTTNKISNISLGESDINNLDAGLFLLPNLSLGGRIWDDINDDTVYDNSLESGIESVVVEIYRDVNQDNEYNVGDTFLATGSTDSSGNYLFTNIRSGNYIIVLPAVNFATGSLLEGYRSSDDTIIADPDNNMSGEDNGVGNGEIISSLAITLLQGTEVGGGNMNLTLDFGVHIEPVIVPQIPSGGGSSSSKKVLSVQEPVEKEINTEELVQKPTKKESLENIIEEEKEKLIFPVEKFTKKIEKFETPVYIEVKNEIIKPVNSFTNILPKELPRTGTKISERVNTLVQSTVETALPDNTVFRLAGSENEDIEYWKQVLVEQDRNATKYIVVPSNGLVIPINEFSQDSDNFNKMINGQEGDINPSLETGALEYPWAGGNGYGEEGNKVIFAHSSYWRNSPGRYKTHFQKIIELDAGEQIWIYEKNDTGAYERYRYITEKSYNTSADDVDVLLPGEGKNLTLFTCTPIGGIEGRWIIKAKYIEDNISKESSNEDVILEERDYFHSLEESKKDIINDHISDLKIHENRELIGYELYQRLEELLLKNDNNDDIVLILEYMQYRIIIEIFDISE